MVHLHVERTIAASPERVFDWLADPASLTAAPLVFKAVWAKGAKPGAGALREVTGVGMWFREEITAYDAPHSYSYLIVRSFPAFDARGWHAVRSPRPRRVTAPTSTGTPATPIRSARVASHSRSSAHRCSG